MSKKQMVKPKEIFDLLSELKEQGFSKAQAINKVIQKKNTTYFTSEEDCEIIKEIAGDVFQIFNKENPEQIGFSFSEVTKILEIKKPEIQLIALSFLIYGKLNFHSSFWIKYDRRVIARMAKIKNEDKIILPLLNEASCKLGIDYSVIGSKKPMPCFRLDYMDKNQEKDNFIFFVPSSSSVEQILKEMEVHCGNF